MVSCIAYIQMQISVEWELPKEQEPWMLLPHGGDGVLQLSWFGRCQECESGDGSVVKNTFPEDPGDLFVCFVFRDRVSL